MDTNKMRDISREQFEAWHKNQKAGLVALGYVGAARQHEELKGLMTDVWQASREAFHVQMPEVVIRTEYDQECDYANGRQVMLDECRAAIEAQGLKVAP